MAEYLLDLKRCMDDGPTSLSSHPTGWRTQMRMDVARPIIDGGYYSLGRKITASMTSPSMEHFCSTHMNGLDLMFEQMI